MKHIKRFSQLNESKQDGLEIMDAIINSPEGKDLAAAINYDGSLQPGQPKVPITDLFDLKNTGRVWIKGTYGSKSYIEKIDGSYTLVSRSMSKIFSQEDYPNIKDCLRGAWSNALGKRSASLGIKKKDYREWLETNIEPGQELSHQELLSIFHKEKTGKELPDLTEVIKNTPVIKPIKKFFPDSIIPDGRIGFMELKIILSGSKDLLLLLCEDPNIHRLINTVNMYIPVHFNVKMFRKKTSVTRRSGGSGTIEIGTEDPNQEGNIDRLIRELAIESIKGYLSNRCPLLEEAFISIFSGNADNMEEVFDNVADSIISKGEPSLFSQAKKNPVLWDKIEKKMGSRKSGTASKLGDLGF